MHMLPGVGHLSPLEAPAEVAQIIAGFLATVESNAAGSK
jgi:pimeloyl-ACP methyl ester carboxylesterase